MPLLMKREKGSERRIKRMLLRREAREVRLHHLREKVHHQQKEHQLRSKRRMKAPRLSIQKLKTTSTMK